MSQYFQRRKWLVKQSYVSKAICGQSLVNLAQSAGGCVNIRTANVNTSTDDVSIRTTYLACAGGDMCHANVSMMTWQHERLPCVTHIWHFWSIPWTSKNFPRGNLYSLYSGVALTWQMRWHSYSDVALTWQDNGTVVDVIQ
jgi:hypothetical protein